RSAFSPSAEATLAKKVHRRMLDRGFILSPRCSGFLSSVMTEPEITGLGQAFADTLQDLE
ncbi:MAG: hypothetical protein P8N43_07465, partial [Alphaproteobacteria bacterium]|nr:hypothetical protein [Alphaproteobacteria bacterium]